MGYIKQVTSSIADSNKFSSSCWIYIKSADFTPVGAHQLAIPIIQFGPRFTDFSWHSDGAFSRAPISVTTSGLAVYFFSNSVPGQLQLFASSKDGAITARSGYAGATAAGIGFIATYQHGSTSIPLDAWVHIAVGLRINTTSSTFYGYDIHSQPLYTVTSYCDCNMVINAVDDSPHLQDWYDEKGIVGSMANNNAKATTASSTVYNGGGDAYINNIGSVTSDFDYPSGQTISQFDIAFSGFPIGLPSDDGNAVQIAPYYYPDGTCPKVRYGDFQFWAGQYIDWTNPTNFAKVVSVSAGKGTPVDPAVAASSFGTPTLRFIGNHTQFVNNTGTGGSFTLTGTDVDFTPTPSYG